MKYDNRLTLLLLLLITFSSAYGQKTVTRESRSATAPAQSGKQGPTEPIQKMIAAWNSHDADKVVAAFTDGAVYEDVSWGHTFRGKAELGKFVRETLAAVGDFKMELSHSSAHNGHGFAEWTWSGTDLGLLKT